MHPASGLSIEDRDRVAETSSKRRGASAKSGSGTCSRPTGSRGESTRIIADVVNELGLQPWKPPEPLDPIDEEEMNLVVWMGVIEMEA